MTIKSFKERSEELEKEFNDQPININGKYSLEFEQWLRSNRNGTEEENKTK